MQGHLPSQTLAAEGQHRSKRAPSQLGRRFNARRQSLLCCRDNSGELARGITLGHARAWVLFYPILWERVAEPVLRQGVHAFNCLHQVLRR